MPKFDLKPAQIQKLNRMKKVNLNPTEGGTLITADKGLFGSPAAVVKAGEIEIKLTWFEVLRL